MIKVPHQELEYPGDGLYYLDGQPFTGVAFRLARDGFERSQIEYREGLRWGAVHEWYAPGQPKVEASYYKGALHGRAREWHRNGNPAEDGAYEYGITLWEKNWEEDGTLTKDYRLEPSHPDFLTLERYRALYAGDPETSHEGTAPGGGGF
jgi:antitoxin component YwqK of YwqJK toxin-antitoxin module